MKKILLKRIKTLLLAVLTIALFFICIQKINSKTIQKSNYIKTGYFTKLYIRENTKDMPRQYKVLVTKDGKIIPIWFHRYSAKNKGKFSIKTFDPRDYLGKVITLNFQGNTMNNNQEFPTYKNEKIELTPRICVDYINSLTILKNTYKIDKKYRYPQKDTLIIPHDVTIKKQDYKEKSPSQIKSKVDLTTFVKGKGTQKSPYTSIDGSAGLKQAFDKLPNGGTVNIKPGFYQITTKDIKIPRFISLKGINNSTSEGKPIFTMNQENVWLLQGSNTIDNLKVDISSNNKRYSGQIIVVDNNAKNVTIKDCAFQGAYSVNPITYKESKNAVFIRFKSHINNITITGCSFKNILRSISTKGQRDQHYININHCLFEGSNSMCITFDQSSNITNVIVDNNLFKEFSHFGVAFARINDVKITNNKFQSTNKLSYNTYNMAIHIEEHCQNFIIENNTIDTKLRVKDNANTNTRCSGISVTDSRYIHIKNNLISHANILFSGKEDNIGFSTIEKNKINDAGIIIRDAYRYLTIKNNIITNPADIVFNITCTTPSKYPFGWFTIESNKATQMQGKQPLKINAQLQSSSIVKNIFSGKNLIKNEINLLPGSKNNNIQNIL